MNTDSGVSGHISKRFDSELEDLRNKVMTMGGLVETQVNLGIRALMESDSSIAQKVAEDDYKINAMEVEIDEECVQILARRQPAASDLRLIVAIIKTITDLERIGDLAEKLGQFELELIDEGSTSTEYAKLEHLGDRVSKMLNRALNAFARMDDEEAIKTIKKDKKINAEYDSLMRQLITRMMEDPRNIQNALRVTWCARSLERMGDHARNICEYVLFLVHGKDVRHIDFNDLKNQIDQISS
jgi:phosphate transport system protein